MTFDDDIENAVLVERDGPVVTVVLNRPEKLNALNRAMWIRLNEVFPELDADESIRCIVLRGAGDKAMGPGADISEFETYRNNAEQGAEYGGYMHGALAAIRQCRHPVVAMIKGLCVGGAMELSLMCDLRICGESSRFGVPISKLGLVMAYPEMEARVGLVGPSVALEILYEARVFAAEEAKEKGLVNRIVPDDEVEAAVAETVDRICAGAPLVNRWHKKFAYRLQGGIHPIPPLSDEQKAEGFACFDTEDYREGIRAFLAKDKPKFKGK